jgi:soluble lytic murein transglycosylase-like protein
MIMILAMLSGTTSPTPLQVLEPLIAQASAESRLPGAWIASVIAAESGGRSSGPHGGVRSPAGAMGVMQIMPQTWSDIAGSQAYHLDPDRSRDNIMVGSAYLLTLYRRFGFPGAIAAYHAGPGNYRAFLSGRHDLPDATRKYVETVLGHLGVRSAADGQSGRCDQHPSVRIFALTKPSPGVCTVHSADPGGGGLFVSLERERPRLEP